MFEKRVQNLRDFKNVTPFSAYYQLRRRVIDALSYFWTSALLGFHLILMASKRFIDEKVKIQLRGRVFTVQGELEI